VLAAARELAHLGITANLVEPGPTDTGWMSAEQRGEFAGRNPQGSLYVVEDTRRAGDDGKVGLDAACLCAGSAKLSIEPPSVSGIITPWHLRVIRRPECRRDIPAVTSECLCDRFRDPELATCSRNKGDRSRSTRTTHKGAMVSDGRDTKRSR
jgi:hypothetical protein